MWKKLTLSLALLAFTSTAEAAREARILYLGIDEAKGLVDKQSQPFERIFDHTGNFLHHQGIRVLEEAQNGGSNVRSFSDAMDVVEKVRRRNLDAVVIVSVRHQQKYKGYKLKDRLIAKAQVIDPHSLEIMETISEKSPVAHLREGDCRQACQNMILRRHVREVLPDFQDKLLSYLRDIKPRKAKVKQEVHSSKITLTLKGFSPREVRHIEDRVADLDSTRDLSWLTSTDRKPTFWLERKDRSKDITTELGDVLSNLNLSARIIKTPRYVTLIKVNNDVALLD